MKADISRWTGVLILCAALAGCAEPADRTAMVPVSISAASAAGAYRGAVSTVSSFGGDETNPMWTSEISAEDFKAALEQSLRQAGILASGGRYTLRADILDVQQPLVGFDVTVTMSVRYNLIDAAGRVRWDQTVTSKYTAKLSEALVGVERLKKANEGAARENIALLLKALGASAQGSAVGAVS